MAIAHDNSTTATTTTASKTNTGTSSDGILLVGVVTGLQATDTSAWTVSTTYAGSAMTNVLTGSTAAAVGLHTSSTSACAWMFALLNPATGANNVVVTISGGTPDGFIMGASSYTGVAGGYANASSTTSNGATNSPSLSLSSATNDLVYAFGFHGDTISGSGTGTTTRAGPNNFGALWSLMNLIGGEEAGASSVSIDFTSGVSDHWALIGVNLQATAPAPPPNLLLPVVQSSMRLR